MAARCNGGYVPGEKLQLMLDIDNKTDDEVSKVSVTLEQVRLWLIGAKQRTLNFSHPNDNFVYTKESEI